MSSVLIVEDDRDVREMLHVLISTSGYDTQTAENGLVALQAMRTHRPCVVLLDIMMPVMDGWEFRERQLADPALADVPVVCVTAVFDRQTVSERLRLPCLVKPVDFGALLDHIAAACSK